jgi:DMSO/TMAO reductase YedYZ molybdopterin-dependent catalytic subunit
MVAYAINDQALPMVNGFPIRLIVPVNAIGFVRPEVAEGLRQHGDVAESGRGPRESGTRASAPEHRVETLDVQARRSHSD